MVVGKVVTVGGGAVDTVTGTVTVDPGAPGGPGGPGIPWGPGGPGTSPTVVVGRVEGGVRALPRDPVVGGVMEGAVRVVGTHPSVVGPVAATANDTPTSSTTAGSQR